MLSSQHLLTILKADTADTVALRLALFSLRLACLRLVFTDWKGVVR